MATLDQIGKALKAADAAGNKEDAAALAREYARLQAASAPTVSAAKPNDVNLLDSALHYGTGGLIDKLDAAAQAAGLPGGVPGDSFSDRYQKNLTNIRAGYGSYAAENPEKDYAAKAAGTVAPMLIPVGEIGSLGRVAGTSLVPAGAQAAKAAPTLAERVLSLAKTNAALGAGYGFGAAPDKSLAEDAAYTAGGAVLGGATGAATPFIGKAAGTVLNPDFGPAVGTLLKEGVRLTPGQIIGGGVRGAEDKLASVPVLGSFVAGAQRRSGEDFNRAVMDRALAPIGQSLPDNVPLGRKAVDHVATTIGGVYDNILPKMTGVVDPQFMNDLNAIGQAAKGSGIAADTIDRLKNVIQSQLADKVDPATGTYSGDTLKSIQSELTRLHSKWSGSDSADDRILGDAIGDVHGAFRNMLERNNPNYASDLQNADNAWAQYARIRRAASSAGAKDGVFTPNQFASAVRMSDQSVGRGQYARGNALMQDLSDAGSSILPQTIPDSGTAGRLMMAAALTGGHALPITAPIATTGTLGSLLYTRPGQAAIRALLTKRPAWMQATGDALTNANPNLSIPLAAMTGSANMGAPQ